MKYLAALLLIVIGLMGVADAFAQDRIDLEAAVRWLVEHPSPSDHEYADGTVTRFEPGTVVTVATVPDKPRVGGVDLTGWRGMGR